MIVISLIKNAVIIFSHLNSHSINMPTFTAITIMPKGFQKEIKKAAKSKSKSIRLAEKAKKNAERSAKKAELEAKKAERAKKKAEKAC